MFAQRLKELREEAGLTQDELAKKLNLTQSTIAYYENGKKMPTMENAKILAQIFNISLDYLFGKMDKTKTAHLEESKLSLIGERLSHDINNLSSESLKDLEDYINLLKIRDMQKRNGKLSDELTTLD
ncbi:MAG: helix-turn-helix domain-containing protein [Tissierellaceae bacterium]|nr:helix-turn-helix domain-containing protein [Tissierellaceae bacterium]